MYLLHETSNPRNSSPQRSQPSDVVSHWSDHRACLHAWLTSGGLYTKQQGQGGTASQPHVGDIKYGGKYWGFDIKV